MRTTVDNWIATCVDCQQRNKSTWVAPLQPIVATQPMERWQMDFSGPYIYEKGGEIKEKKVSCLLATDCFSKMLFGDIFSDRKCERVAAFVEVKIQEEGPFTIMQADNAGEFGGALLKAIYSKYGI